MKYQGQIPEISKKILGGSIGTFLQIILSIIIIAGVLLVSTSLQGKNLIMRVAGDNGKEILDITVGTVYQVVKKSMV